MPSGMEYTPGHEFERLLRHGEDMWVHGPHVLPTVHLYEFIAVDGQLLVRINGHQNDPTVRVDTVPLQKPDL